MAETNEFAFSRDLFCDVDQYCEWEVQQGWDIGGSQLSNGKNLIRYDTLALPNLALVQLRAQQSMYNVFSLPPGVVLFFIPRMRDPVVWSGSRIEPSVMPVVPPGQAHFAVLPADLNCYEIFLSEELVRKRELLPADFLGESRQSPNPEVPIVDPERTALTTVIDLLFRRARRPVSDGDSGIDPVEASEFLLEGLQNLVDAGLRSRNGSGSRGARRADLVSEARDFLVENLDGSLTADEIAESLGVSTRVLRYAFRDTLGVSPYHYHLIERLHAVRRKLQSDHVSVTDASYAHGFNTPSRFARQYKRLFGELPSETRFGRF